MRFFQSLVFSAFFLLAGVSSAWAFGFTLSTSSATDNLSIGDSVTVNVFFDADGGVTIVSVAVINSADHASPGRSSNAWPHFDTSTNSSRRSPIDRPIACSEPR